MIRLKSLIKEAGLEPSTQYKNGKFMDNKGIAHDSKPAADAANLGLIDKKYGRYGDPQTGQVVAKVVNGELVKLGNKAHTKMSDDEKAFHSGKGISSFDQRKAHPLHTDPDFNKARDDFQKRKNIRNGFGPWEDPKTPHDPRWQDDPAYQTYLKKKYSGKSPLANPKAIDQTMNPDEKEKYDADVQNAIEKNPYDDYPIGDF